MPTLALKRKANGDCYYLGPTGCTIHDRAPALCREFDCRTLFTALTRQERRPIEQVNGANARGIFAAGRKRPDTR
jgi:uncharacterized protein